ncbi:MAG TPA: hypothetical protein VET24_13010 [Actinomycetota bacterium]|nr:hypothetical protein [Actinomycetota bacterium]
MTAINPAFVEDLVGPLIGGGDIDEEFHEFSTVDPDDEQQVRDVIRRLLVPYFYDTSPEGQRAAKLGLAWYLTFRPDRLSPMYDRLMLPFREEPVHLWEWIWRELFGDEDYHLKDDPASFEIKDDPHTVMITRARHHGRALGNEWDNPPPPGQPYLGES